MSDVTPSARRGYLLHHFLADAAQRSPDAVALECAGKTATYAELDRRSDAIAALFQSLGVERGDLVGIALPKSVDTIAAWFGALKAGAAYVPMDASSPAPRLRAIAETGRLKLLVADARRKELVEALAGAVAHVVWDRASEVPGPSLAEARGTPTPTDGIDLDLAYVYFTSGSTGRPKGVLITHRASLSYLDAGDAIVQARADDVIANHAPLAFDLASWDVHLAVRAGARLSLVPEASALMPGSLLQFFEQQKPTLLYTVPTTLNRLAALQSIGSVTVPSLRGLLFAGEAPNLPALRTMRGVFPNATFHHWYGSTEAALVTAAAFPPGEALPDPLPIGRAVANVELALLGEGGRVALGAPGSTGELLVRATLLLEGYCNEEALTEQAFLVERGAGGVPGGARWFHTRDLVRHVGDGVLHYVSRIDRMVKVKGLRVDLGEIETVLSRHAGVQECAVVAVPDRDLGAKLHAFVVVAPEVALDGAALRSYLRGHVSAHMVPESVRSLPTLPRTASGKVDKLALAALCVA